MIDVGAFDRFSACSECQIPVVNSWARENPMALRLKLKDLAEQMFTMFSAVKNKHVTRDCHPSVPTYINIYETLKPLNRI